MTTDILALNAPTPELRQAIDSARAAEDTFDARANALRSDPSLSAEYVEQKIREHADEANAQIRARLEDYTRTAEKQATTYRASLFRETGLKPDQRLNVRSAHLTVSDALRQSGDDRAATERTLADLARLAIDTGDVQLCKAVVYRAVEAESDAALKIIGDANGWNTRLAKLSDLTRVAKMVESGQARLLFRTIDAGPPVNQRAEYAM